jgi:2-polyprenyl-3-methyl-5-hydroxy-6-metoxy-1,4-benzoquinol methylase
MDNRGDLKAEAAAFSERIKERVAAGYIPDLRRATKCDYFYQSYWRDPYFAHLFVGESTRTFLELLERHRQQHLSLLDVGCGPGYISLELARAGYHVTAIDISEGAIEAARQTLAENPYKEGFGSLEYHVMPLETVTGSFDIVLFSGSLHHFDDPEQAVMQGLNVLNPGGLLICHEPCREVWTMNDAAQAALIRLLLTLTGIWYEPVENEEVYGEPAALQAYIKDMLLEYTEERDKKSGLQSPQDNATDGQAILEALRKHLRELDYRPGFAYLYRMLGGMRGPDELIHRLADFLATYEKLALQEGYLQPATFFFIGQHPK